MSPSQNGASEAHLQGVHWPLGTGVEAQGYSRTLETLRRIKCYFFRACWYQVTGCLYARAPFGTLYLPELLCTSRADDVEYLFLSAPAPSSLKRQACNQLEVAASGRGIVEFTVHRGCKHVVPLKGTCVSKGHVSGMLTLRHLKRDAGQLLLHGTDSSKNGYQHQQSLVPCYQQVC